MTPQEKIKNNEFLLNLDMDNASREQKIAWLCQMIKNETEKPEDQRDFDLIVECTEYMQELTAEDAMLSQKAIDSALQEIKNNHPIEREVKKTIAKRPKKLLKIAAAVAAMLVILFSALTVTAKIKGYSNAWDFLLENMDEVSKMEPGDSMEGDGITLIKGGKSITYGSIEELISTEGYDILYPSKLPNDIQITKVAMNEISDEHSVFTFSFNDMDLSLFVSNNFEISQEDLSTCETFETEEMIFYIKTFSSGIYQATGYDENFEYRITYTNYDNLKMILENMKGIKK